MEMRTEQERMELIRKEHWKYEKKRKSADSGSLIWDVQLPVCS